MSLSPRVKRLLSQGFVVALAAGALALAFRKANIHEIGTTLRHARVSYLLLAALVISISYGVRGVRWRVLLSAERCLPIGTVFWANMVGYLGNNLLPARAGEVLRSALLGRATGISGSYIFATAVTERILDVIVLVLLCFLAVLALPHPPAWLQHAALLAGLAACIGALLLSLAAFARPLFLRLAARIPASEFLRSRIVKIADHFLLGLRAIHHPARAASFLGMAITIWLLDATGSIIGAKALSLTLSLPQALVLLTALGLASALPSTPGAIGLFQLAAVGVLVPLGYSRSNALAYILLAQASGYIVVGVWGAIGLWRLGRSVN